MITFLDFHRTIFDTDAYDVAVRDGETVDPSAFVYPDAAQALRSLENNGVVITSAAEDFVASALKHIPRLTILATLGVGKAAYLASWPGYYGQAAVFVDDSPDELVQLTDVHPALTGVEIRRDGKEGHGRFKVITSLSEL
jgi:hypothetical protein